MNTRRLSFPPRTQAGVSLVELMIALTIGFIIIAGVGYLYLGSRQAFRTQDSLTSIQESARYALEVMSRDIRMAGYLGCGNLSYITPVVNAKALNGGAISPSTALQVFPNGTGWTAPSGVVRAAGDVLRIFEAAGGGVAISSSLPGAAANVQIASNNYGIQQNDVVLISDCQTHADVFGVTSMPSSNTLAHGANLNVGTTLSYAYTVGPPPAYVFKFQQIDYFIGCPTAAWNGATCSQPLALYQVINNGPPQPLVDNVENMAFRLGLDTTSSGAVNQVNVAPGAGTNWSQVRSVRVHLLLAGNVAGESGSNVTVTKQTYTFNGQAYTANDNRIYQEAVATVAIRNRL